jgi:vanillate O-demethylase ferredoxin subunit
MKPAARKTILAMHRWAGLTVGLVALFLALTGLTMAFRAQLEPVVDANLLARAECAAPVPLDALVDRARAAYPGKAVTRIDVLDAPPGATVVRFADRMGFYFDRCSGEVVAQRNAWGGFFGFIEQVHKFRFISEESKVTETIGGTVAVLVALLVFGGVLLAWPASLRALKTQLKPRLDPSSRVFDVVLHRSTGTWIFAVLLLSTTAALMFTFDWAKHAVFTLTGSSLPAPRPAASTGSGTLPFEGLLVKARAAIPGAARIFIAPPKKPTDSVEIFAVGRDAPHMYARDYVYLDPHDGTVLRSAPFALSSPGNKTYRWLQAWHTGRAGLIFQLLLVAGMAGVPVMAFTGIRSYLRRRSNTPSPSGERT